jgi:hypothetical protein
MRRIALLAPIMSLLLFAACEEELVAPAVPFENPIATTANVLTGSIDALPAGGTSNTVMAKAVSPSGWVLGNFYVEGLNVRAQSWSPSPGNAVKTIADIGSVYSGADEHGDVTAHGGPEGPVVYLADPTSGGHPYTVIPLPLPTTAGNPGNWIAKGLNYAHFVVGSGRGDGSGASNPVVWAPTAPGATSWLQPITLPLPNYPRGTSFSEATGVNAAGLVVGTVGENLKRSIINRAWHWRVEQVNGVWTATSLGALPWASGSVHQAASDVNDSGVIVGSVNDGGNSYAALWYPDASGNYTQPPTVRTVAQWNSTHINRCGWTVSSMMSGKGRSGGVDAWNGNEAISLPKMAGSSNSRAWDINDSGFVAGASIFQGKGKTPTTTVATVWRGFVPECPP